MKRNILWIALGMIGLCACSSTPKTKVLSDKERVPLLLELASANLTEGDATGAINALTQAKEINDQVPEEHYLFALAYYQKNEIRMATESARRAVQLDPHFSQAKNTLGKLLMDQGRYTEAEKYLLEAASDLTSKVAYIAKTNLGALYFKKLNYPAAEKWLNSAIADAGDDACMAAYYRGQVFFEQNEFAKAQQDFTRASKKGCSQFSDAYLASGKTLMRMKKYDQARAKLLELQQLFPDSEAAKSANDYLREIP